jgi:WD repeat and SOF domain-containing protein 1
MRVGAGLDNGRRFRRGSIDKWKYIYTEDSKPAATAPTHVTSWDNDPLAPSHPLRKQGTQTLPTNTRTKMSSNAGWCDPERPRIFHIYWSGPFTDKPYLTLMSYLFTQPLGLNSTDIREDCTPQFWVWINPGVQAAVPNGKAYGDMYDDLAANPWSSPFLHKRFHDLIKFKLWNTTAQLDAHDELRGWRQHAWLSKFAVEPDTVLALDDAESLLSAFDESAAEAGVTNAAKEVAKKHGKVEAALIQLQKADAEQVVASDLARFLVTHTHGGAYLDVDNVILRDWEELWGWRGAFAMRWSVHEWYNTAILRMHPGSALGSFLLKSAIASKTTTSAPFHPSAITMYIEDARLAPVLFRIPDAVFDSNFLNMERLQVDRPPYPAYSWESRFEEFFQTPARTGAEANVAGFDAFYRGAFTYHWHNNW